jgi:hypothetical protein
MFGIRHLFYARPGVALANRRIHHDDGCCRKAGWSEGLERLEGSLLGYEEWQTDLHLERFRVSPHAKNFPWLRKSLRGRSATKLPTQIFVRISYEDSRSAVSH